MPFIIQLNIDIPYLHWSKLLKKHGIEHKGLNLNFK